MTLAKFIKENYNVNEEHFEPYGELFHWKIQDYLGSYDYKSCDSKFLKRHGLCKADFDLN